MLAEFDIIEVSIGELRGYLQKGEK